MWWRWCRKNNRNVVKVMDGKTIRNAVEVLVQGNNRNVVNVADGKP